MSEWCIRDFIHVSVGTICSWYRGKCDPFVIINALQRQTLGHLNYHRYFCKYLQCMYDMRLLAVKLYNRKYEIVRPTKTRSWLYPSYLFIVYIV